MSWHMPVIPATQKAEAGERIAFDQEFEVTVSYKHAIALQPGNRVRLCLMNKNLKTWMKDTENRVHDIKDSIDDQ